MASVTSYILHIVPSQECALSLATGWTCKQEQSQENQEEILPVPQRPPDIGSLHKYFIIIPLELLCMGAATTLIKHYSLALHFSSYRH